MFRITEDNRKWWILAAMTTTISMIFIDVTVLPVALPTINRELNISDLQLQWVVNAYTLALTVCVLAGGRIGDLWGVKKSFSFGIMLFALASLLCGFSQSPLWLIANRCLQGVGGAFLLPATQNIIFSSFPPHQRGKALGLFISVGSIFLSLGPLIGGALTQYASWRYIFWINIPIAFIGLALAFVTVQKTPAVKEKFDFFGFVTIGIGISSIVIGLMQSQNWGWDSLKTLSLFLLGILFLILHFKIHMRTVHPLIDFSLFKKRSFLGGSFCIVISQFLFMSGIFWAIYFQNVLHFSPSKAGLLAFSANLPVIIGAPVAGFLVDRFGPRLPVIIGYGLILVGLVMFLFFINHENMPHLLFALIPFGIGAPMTLSPSSISLLSDVPPEKRGGASGLSAGMRQLSATLGLAIFGTLFTSVQYTQLTKSLGSNPSTASLNARTLEGLLSKAPAATQIVDSLPKATATFVTESATEAFIRAISSINLLGIAIACLGVFIAWRFLKNRPLHHHKK